MPQLFMLFSVLNLNEVFAASVFSSSGVSLVCKAVTINLKGGM